MLTGKLGPEREFSEGDQRAVAPRFSVGNRQRVRDFLDRLQPIAARHRLPPWPSPATATPWWGPAQLSRCWKMPLPPSCG
jgi:aryl-alcohol dehydrogenase-like predicted oxidoreductase